MELRVIKNSSEYTAALHVAEELAALDPKQGTPDADKLSVLALLIENYEKSHFVISKPDPIEAIKFRMEQQDLKPRDLIPLIGSRSKVSEVLSGKRSLTLSMIRALHDKLHIPSDVLLKDPDASIPKEADINWQDFPLKEMIKRGWIKADMSGCLDRAEELMRSFLSPLEQVAPLPALFRRTISERAGKKMDRHALYAWLARVQIIGNKKDLPEYRSGVINDDFMREIAQLSWSEHGPAIAVEYLEKRGIAVAIEPHLSGTFLDGASMLGKHRRPIIGLAIRHDRIDSFWFDILHELAHIAHHLMRNSDEMFIDNLDVESTNDTREVEADRAAQDACIPRSRWKGSRAFQQRTPEAISEFAADLKIHPAIIAGRIRHDARNYQILSPMIGHGQVRKLFPQIRWE